MNSALKLGLASVLFSAAAGIAPTANALQYNFDYLNAGNPIQFDLVIDVNTTDGVCPSPGGCLITGISGSSPQYGTVTGLAPPGASVNDNLFFNSAPYLDYQGIAFSVASRSDYLGIYYSGTSPYYLFWDLQRLPVWGTLSVSPVPEPETYAMLLAGLGLLGLLARRRNKKQ